MKELDERHHPFVETEGDPPAQAQQHGNLKQVRQADQDQKESRAAGGDNERGLDYAPKGFSSRVPQPSKQQFEQWASEERHLLRRLSRGDHEAAEILAERYRWKLQGRVAYAIRGISGGIRFDDVFQDAFVRFLEQLKRFKPSSNNGLWAYLWKAIEGAISDALKKWQQKGFTNFDTRLRRFFRSVANRQLTDEEVQKRFPRKSLEEIEQARKPLIEQPYTEGAVDDWNGHQDVDDHTAPSGYAKAVASSDPLNVLGKPSTASQWSKRATLGPRWKGKGKWNRNVGYVTTVDSFRGSLRDPGAPSRKYKWKLYPRSSKAAAPSSEDLEKMVADYLAKDGRITKLPPGRDTGVIICSRRKKRVYGCPWNGIVEQEAAARDEAMFNSLGRQRFHEERMRCVPKANTGDWVDGEWITERKDTYYEVRNGRLVEPNNTPAPFESKVATYYRGTHLTVAKLLSNTPEAPRLVPERVAERDLQWHNRATKQSKEERSDGDA